MNGRGFERQPVALWYFLFFGDGKQSMDVDLQLLRRRRWLEVSTVITCQREEKAISTHERDGHNNQINAIVIFLKTKRAD